MAAAGSPVRSLDFRGPTAGLDRPSAPYAAGEQLTLPALDFVQIPHQGGIYAFKSGSEKRNILTSF